MTNAAPPARTEGRRRDPIRHLRILVPIAIVLAGIIVIAVVQSVRYSHTTSGGGKSTMMTSVGFFTPKDATPVGFSLPLLTPGSGGRTVTMSSLRGKPAVINMWASTCTVCTTETPDLEAIAKKVAGRVDFVGVDTTDQRSPALAFVHRYHVSYTQLFDPSEHVGSGYGIPGLPVTVFISAAGKVVGENIGALDTRTLTYYLKQLFGISV